MSLKSHQPAFTALTGSAPKIELVLEMDFAFAHEAGVFIAYTDELFVTSNRLFDKHGQQRVEISRIRLGNAQTATIRTQLSLSEIAMGNGGTNYRNGMILCAQGSQKDPSGLYYVPITTQETPSLLISDFYGRPFNSINDVMIHSDGSIWFTDPTYAYEQGYRPPLRLPSQVYRFEPSGCSIRAMADGFGRPDGICFSPDEKIVYITDSDWIHGDGFSDDTRVSSIYAFDLAGPAGKQFLANRRLFTMYDTGIPDGIKCDMEGNVYSGCGDGLSI